MAVSDINKDGILQLAEIRLGGDIVVLATPEIGGLPFVISGFGCSWWFGSGFVDC